MHVCMSGRACVCCCWVHGGGTGAGGLGRAQGRHWPEPKLPRWLWTSAILWAVVLWAAVWGWGCVDVLVVGSCGECLCVSVLHLPTGRFVVTTNHPLSQPRVITCNGVLGSHAWTSHSQAKLLPVIDSCYPDDCSHPWCRFSMGWPEV